MNYENLRHLRHSVRCQRSSIEEKIKGLQSLLTSLDEFGKQLDSEIDARD